MRFPAQIIICILTILHSAVIYAQVSDPMALATLMESRFNGWGTGEIDTWAHGVTTTDDGMVWMTTADGIIRYDGSRFLFMAKRNRKYTFFRRIFILNDTIFLGDIDKPLHYYDTSDSIPKISRVQWQKNIEGELFIWSHYEHNDGRIFLADYNGIIYLYDNGGASIDTFFVMPNDVLTDKDLKHTARYIRADPYDEDMIWITSINGIFHLSLKDKSYKFYRPRDKPGLKDKGSEEGFTFYDHIQMGENLWISSYENGLVRFNTITKEFQGFRYELPFDNIQPGTNFIRSHQQYDDYNIIVGGRDLKIFNTEVNKFYEFRREHNDFDPPVLLTVDIHKRGDDYFNISTGSLSKFSKDYNLFNSGDLARIDIPAEIVRIVNIEQQSPHKISITTNGDHQFIWDLNQLVLSPAMEDFPTETIENITTRNSKGEVWTLENDKLLRSSTDSDTSSIVSLDGISNLQSIYFDKNDDLWIKAEVGLVRYKTEQKVFRIFDQLNGLWTNVWSDPGIIKELSDGNLFVSSGTTFAYFHPDSIINQEQTEFIKPYVFKIEVYGDVRILSRDHLVDLETSLAPEENYFSIHYSTQLSNQGQSVEYQYKLEGYDDKWVNVKRSNYTSFSNVPPGKYTFLLKARYPGGIWQDSQNELVINIEPTFYESWLFKLLILLGALLIAYFLYRVRTQYLLKEQRLKSEFHQELSEAKLQSLRNQMNPHFLFNSLNSIDRYILTKQPKEASEYLSKFSKLIRNILEYSTRKLITLAEELETFKIYVDLERLRFSSKFDYTIELNDIIDINEEQVPPSILQPYVENAIWHGLLHKEEKGTLTVSIDKKDDLLIISIDDNGIGRTRASEIKSKSVTTHKSKGMKITEARIRILNELHNLGGKVEIEDKYDTNGLANGTKIVIKIPSKASSHGSKPSES